MATKDNEKGVSCLIVLIYEMSQKLEVEITLRILEVWVTGRMMEKYRKVQREEAILEGRGEFGLTLGFRRWYAVKYATAVRAGGWKTGSRDLVR